MASTKLPARLLDTSAVPALTVTGDLTVDTNTLYVDSGNNNVGIGTTSPGEKFAVKGDASYIEITHPTASSFTGMKFSEGGTPQGSIQNIGSTFATVARRGNLEIFHNTGGNLTLQHPGGNVGIGTSSPSEELEVNGTVKATAFEGDGSALTNVSGGGKLLQVVQTVKTDTWSSSTTATWVDITGLNVSITPASSSNKVLVDVHISLSNYSLASFRLVRGSTVIAVGDNPGGNRVQATMGPISFTRDGHRTSSASVRFLDTPSTTSSTTYKLQAWTYHGTQYINRSYTNQNANYTSSSISTITASEISA